MKFTKIHTYTHTRVYALHMSIYVYVYVKCLSEIRIKVATNSFPLFKSFFTHVFYVALRIFCNLINERVFKK